GQGPEHSSARLERFLQLCAENNMQVCIPTTPAQMFHMLRRQLHRPLRRPLIVMTPKSLLRHKLSVSSVEELVNGRFQPVIDEIDDLDPGGVKRVVLCSGKVYYDILEERRLKGITDVAIVRLEQVHPFPKEHLEKAILRYGNAKELIWCQEEPKNQGIWYQIFYYLNGLRNRSIGQTLSYVG
ncbi:MAG: 2-oxoglutarate dehydrogenase E1 component, partial [Gammaproteobacteria bacterium]|nr:2-oxoglutarate dehydrogenase E1 component [Gammaproteobacteria bacterium]